jgi:GNAT superfamily N-acetyltransferase
MARLARPDVVLKVQAARMRMPRVSSIQRTLYSMLDGLRVDYARERHGGTDAACVVGPWAFDCAVPRPGKPTLLIECQGDYWHGQKGKRSRDDAKLAYVMQRFPGRYEVKYIWEHEFYNYNKVLETLKYWLGIAKIDVVDFQFADVAIRPCPAQDYAPLLTKYHYLPNAGRGGIAFGAYLGADLIAVCVLSPLVRQNIDATLPCDAAAARELSRLCIHPRYQKKNFASWFIMRALPKQFRVIVSYCDTTFNHNGATYKACNFKQDRVVRPDYWYVKPDGWVMHKKTLYEHAKRMQMCEAEFAKKYGYMKVHGREKLRFIFDRNP